MKYYIGIDSGGTKTVFVLVDEKGHVIDKLFDSTTNYLQIGISNMSKVIKRNICLLIEKYHLNIENTCIYIGLASFGEIKEDIPKIKKAIKKATLNIKCTIGNDNNSAWAGSLKAQKGINIVSGTGSIAFGVDDYNNEQRVGGWGYFYNGDEGSGHWIGSKLINEFEKQADHRHKRTLIYKYIKDEFKFDDDFELLNIIVNEWKMDRTKIAALSPIVFKAAKNKDEAAIKIVDEACQELASHVNTLVKTLKFKGKIKVSYSGGIFNNGNIIIKPFKKYLNKRCVVIKPALEPMYGSVLLAMKSNNQKITKEIIGNLKSSQ